MGHRLQHIGRSQRDNCHAYHEHNVKRCPDRHVNAIQSVPVAVQGEGNRGIQRAKTSDIRAGRTPKEFREAGAILCDGWITTRPDALNNHGGQGRDSAYCDTCKHHNMWWDQRAITPYIRMPLNIPTGAKEKE